MMVEEVRQHLEQLLSAGMIRKSKSPWASNIVLVSKKNGSLGMCVDYRCLKNRTVKDAYALPRTEEVFDVLKGSKYFSTIDMKSVYQQEEHKERQLLQSEHLDSSNIIGCLLVFRILHPPTSSLGDYNMTICIIYLDDLIGFADTFEEHLHRLDLVLTRLAECNLKLSPEKCIFVQERVKFLEHVVSSDGVESDPLKIGKIRNWPEPTKPEKLRPFLAIAGYYRRFIKDFSKVTRPLADLVPPSSQKKGQKKTKEQWSWTMKEKDIFQNLKEVL